MAHFLLTTFGSLGDLHPYIAVGMGLRNRGHRVTIATSEVYRAKVEGEGLNFHPVRPDLGLLIRDPAVVTRAFHPRTGSEYVIRDMMLPYLEQSYADLSGISRDADLMVGHPISFAVPIIAEMLGKRWISVALQPSLMLSAFDPPTVSGYPYLDWFRGCGPGFWNWFWEQARRTARRWGDPINALRRKAELREVRNPVLDDMFSPWGTQAWFSKVLASPQADWPPKTAITGYPFYDSPPGQRLSGRMASFLDAGPPPVVFTLGSSAVFDAGRFYEESVKAAKTAGCRAVLLIGRDPRNQPTVSLPDDGIVASEYEPFSELFPRAAAVVHQGGAGTTGQVLRAGVPMCVVPFSHDQPDYARRCKALGVARVVPRRRYRAARVARELSWLLADRGCRAAASGVAREMAKEDGVAAACDGLERAVTA